MLQRGGHLKASAVYGYGNFAIGLDPKFFHKHHIQKFKIMVFDIQSKSQAAHSAASQQKYLVTSILSHEAKYVAILPLVKHDWFNWSREKTRVRI